MGRYRGKTYSALLSCGLTVEFGRLQKIPCQPLPHQYATGRFGRQEDTREYFQKAFRCAES